MEHIDYGPTNSELPRAMLFCHRGHRLSLKYNYMREILNLDMNRCHIEAFICTRYYKLLTHASVFLKCFLVDILLIPLDKFCRLHVNPVHD